MTVEITRIVHKIEIAGASGGASSGNSVNVPGTTGANVAAFFAIALLNGLLYQADITNVTHAGKVVGIAGQSGLTGESIRIFTDGRLTGFPGTLTPGATYFIGPSGQLTTTPLTVGAAWRQKVGIAESANVLFVQLEDPVLT